MDDILIDETTIDEKLNSKSPKRPGQMDDEEMQVYRILREKYQKLKYQIYKILTSNGKATSG